MVWKLCLDKNSNLQVNIGKEVEVVSLSVIWYILARKGNKNEEQFLFYVQESTLLEAD